MDAWEVGRTKNVILSQPKVQGVKHKRYGGLVWFTTASDGLIKQTTSAPNTDMGNRSNISPNTDMGKRGNVSNDVGKLQSDYAQRDDRKSLQSENNNRAGLRARGRSEPRDFWRETDQRRPSIHRRYRNPESRRGMQVGSREYVGRDLERGYEGRDLRDSRQLPPPTRPRFPAEVGDRPAPYNGRGNLRPVEAMTPPDGRKIGRKIPWKTIDTKIQYGDGEVFYCSHLISIRNSDT